MAFRNFKVCYNYECPNIEKYDKKGIEKFCPECGSKLKTIKTKYWEGQGYKILVRKKENPDITNRTLKDAIKDGDLSVGTTGGALAGGLLFGPVGAVAGGLLGHSADRARDTKLQKEILEELKKANKDKEDGG